MIHEEIPKCAEISNESRNRQEIIIQVLEKISTCLIAVKAAFPKSVVKAIRLC